MPSITLKAVPEDMLARLHTAAGRARRGRNQEAIVLSEGGLVVNETAEERAERQAAAWRSLASGSPRPSNPI